MLNPCLTRVIAQRNGHRVPSVYQCWVGNNINTGLTKAPLLWHIAKIPSRHSLTRWGSRLIGANTLTRI